ncbi:MAG: translation initiation factor 2 [Oscillospiraceae bacterium]|nr:translation initiation factor 2 [Oscillospiraceae bacterium]
MVKGTSRRVIVVDSPDPKLFEQAIFIVKNEAFTKGVTSQQVLGEACRIAQGYAARQRLPFWKRIPRWGLIAAALLLAGIAAGVLLWLL